jgi:hypothetical protein
MHFQSKKSERFMLVAKTMDIMQLYKTSSLMSTFQLTIEVFTLWMLAYYSPSPKKTLEWMSETVRSVV